MLIVKIDRKSAGYRLATLIRESTDTPLRFDLAMDLSAGMQAAWWSYLAWLIDRIELGDRLVTTNKLSPAIWYQLITGLLLAQPNNFTATITDDSPRFSLRYVRAAVDFIDTHPERPATVQDIATAAGVSVRTLQHGFHDQLHDTPTNRLYSVRLQRVHDDLRETDPESSRTVDEVTAYWNVAQSSKFYRDYRQRFGETPAVTKRAARPDR